MIRVSTGPDTEPLPTAQPAAPAVPADLAYQTPTVDPDHLRRRRRGRLVSLLAACAIVAAAFVAMMLLFDVTLRPTRFAFIRGNERPAEYALKAFVLRLFLAWVWTTLVAVAALAFSRRRGIFAWIALALLLGLLSAALWGANSGGYAGPLQSHKAAKILANGFFVLAGVVHVTLTTTTIQDRRFGPLPQRT